MPLHFIHGMVRGFIANREFVRQQLSLRLVDPLFWRMYRTMPPVAPCMETWLSMKSQAGRK